MKALDFSRGQPSPASRRQSASLLKEHYARLREEQTRRDAAWLEWRKSHQPHDPASAISWSRRAELEAEQSRASEIQLLADLDEEIADEEVRSERRSNYPARPAPEVPAKPPHPVYVSRRGVKFLAGLGSSLRSSA